jgi:membrane protease YdiL (CAAX protease family)
MNQSPALISGAESSHGPSKLTAWRNALAVTLLGCLLLGLGCFVWLGRVLPRHMDLFHAAVWQQVGFGVALGLILAVIVVWQRIRGSSLAELGWAKPTTKLALALAVLLGAAYIWGSYFGARFVLRGVDVAEPHWGRFALAPLGIFMAIAEETMMRGFFMTELQRARVATWLQIIASGACSAVYHALHNPTPLGFFPSFGLFTAHAGLYVLGKRSLTPTIVAHSIYHVLGEPYLLMMVLAATPQQ